jgi:superfamily II DNA or RNA helicase
MKKTKDQIQAEALDALSKVKRGTVAMSVGTGKTLVGLKHMASLYHDNAFFLVVAPKISIFQSWKDDAKKFDMEYLISHITFSTYLSLINQDIDYQAVYLDEAHSLLKSHSLWLNDYQGILIGLTGTPPKIEQSEKGKMFKQFIPVVYKYETDTAIEDNILNDYKIIVHTLELDTKQNMKAGKAPKFFYTSESANYKYWTGRCHRASSDKEIHMMRIMRMKAIMNFPTKEAYAKNLLMSTTEKTLLFANTQEQADRLCDNSYHSGNPNSEYNLQDFKAGKIDELSCVLQLSEGINIPNLKIGIIMHAYGNERKASQRIGRLLRLNPNDKSTIHVLCYINTIDEDWVIKALEDYDQTKITWI